MKTTIHTGLQGIGKVIPAQTWTDLENSGKLRLPDFMKIEA
jgi:hypothetical protein